MRSAFFPPPHLAILKMINSKKAVLFEGGFFSERGLICVDGSKIFDIMVYMLTSLASL